MDRLRSSGSTITELEELIEPTVQYLGYRLWGIERSGSGQFTTLRVYIDVENGVTIDDCERVSTQLSTLLEVEQAIPGPYELQVSSPGLDRVLFKPEHYQSNLGAQVDVRLHYPLDGTRRVKGVLEAIDDDHIAIRTADGTNRIAMAQVRRTRLIPQFD